MLAIVFFSISFGAASVMLVKEDSKEPVFASVMMVINTVGILINIMRKIE